MLGEEECWYALCLQGMKQATMVVVASDVPGSDDHEDHDAQDNNGAVSLRCMQFDQPCALADAEAA